MSSLIDLNINNVWQLSNKKIKITYVPDDFYVNCGIIINKNECYEFNETRLKHLRLRFCLKTYCTFLLDYSAQYDGLSDTPFFTMRYDHSDQTLFAPIENFMKLPDILRFAVRVRVIGCTRICGKKGLPRIGEKRADNRFSTVLKFYTL